MSAPQRLNVTLDPEHAAKLSRLAAQTYVQEGTLARSLLSRAIDDVDLEAETMAELLNGIPGSLDRALRGREEGRAGKTVPLDEL